MNPSSSCPARNTLTLSLVMVFVAACNIGSYDDAVSQYNAGTDAPPPPPPPPPGGMGPNFSEIQENIFTPSCATSSCHSATTASAGLNLEAASSYAMLVGMASTQDPGTQRVNPFNPDISYLIQKLEGPGATGGQMPPNGSVATSDITTIRQWITAGAVDDRVQASTPIRVSSLSITPNSTLTAAPTQIVADFDRALDPSTVNPATFILQTSAGVGITATSINVPIATPQSAIFSLTGVVLANDTYTVRLLGSGASIIMDLAPNALDGEYLGGFPSGNGAEGGDFVAQFTIATPVVIGPTLDEIQAAVFTPTCATSNCHSNGAQAAGLSLADADTSYLELVDQFSGQVVNKLVEPNIPDTSYLIMKLENAPGIENSPMPIGQPLPQSDINVIRLWIENGALR